MAITITAQKKTLKFKKPGDANGDSADSPSMHAHSSAPAAKIKKPHYITFAIFGIFAFCIMIAVIVTEVKELNFYVFPPVEFPILTKQVVAEDGIDAASVITVSPWVSQSGMDSLAGRFAVASAKWGRDAVWASVIAWPVLVWFALAFGAILSKASRNAWSVLLPGYNVFSLSRVAGKPIWWMVVALVPFVIGAIFLLPLLLLPWHLMIWTIAQKPGIASDGGFLIPMYNVLLGLKIAGYPAWWFGLPFFLITGILFSLPLADRFGKGVGFAISSMIFPFINFPALGFGSSEYTEPPAPQPKAPPAPAPAVDGEAPAKAEGATGTATGGTPAAAPAAGVAATQKPATRTAAPFRRPGAPGSRPMAPGAKGPSTMRTVRRGPIPPQKKAPTPTPPPAAPPAAGEAPASPPAETP